RPESCLTRTTWPTCDSKLAPGPGSTRRWMAPLGSASAKGGSPGESPGLRTKMAIVPWADGVAWAVIRGAVDSRDDCQPMGCTVGVCAVGNWAEANSQTDNNPRSATPR